MDRHGWADPTVEEVAPGVHRIPLPLPDDGLRAVNVYAIEDGDSLVLVDGGWAIEAARTLLETSLAALGHDLGGIRRFLVTHAHRDHYSLAVVLRRTFGSRIALGIGEQPNLEALRADPEEGGRPTLDHLTRAGAHKIVERLRKMQPQDLTDLCEEPDEWLRGEVELPLASRTLTAIPTPGHTRGHVVFVDRAAGLLFAGDHVLPHITPSIGFETVPSRTALVDYLDSLATIRELPDLRLLPAHGPARPTTHDRVDALVAHHDVRLQQCMDAVAAGASTAWDVSRILHWTRRETAFDDLDGFNRMLAVNETLAHLELLVRRGDLLQETTERVAHHQLASTPAVGAGG